MNPKQLQNAKVSMIKPASSITAMVVHSVDESGAFVSPGAGSTQVSIKEILSSSGGSLIDSSNVSLGVTIRAGSAAGTEYTDGDVDATITGQALLFDNSSNTLRPVTLTRGLPVNIVAGQSTTVNVSSVAGRVEVGDYSTAVAPPAGSSGLIVRLSAPLMDSTNNAIRVFQVASSGGASSTEVTVRQSTYTDLGTLSRIADRDTSSNVAAVLNVAAPASTVYALAVRLPAPYADSTNNAIRVFQVASSGGASSTEVTIRQSTYTDLNTLSRLADRDTSSNIANVTNTTPASTAYALAVREVVPQSTTIQVSSLAGKVLVDQNSTVWPVQVSSVAGKVLVDQNSTVWFTQALVRTSSGGGVEGSTTTPSQGALGLHVRPVFPTLQSTTLLITSTNSTAFYTLIDAAGAGVKNKVFAYFVGSTHTLPSTAEFISSTSAPKWAVGFGSGSSGITGANLAVSPPAYLFETAANSSLTFRVAANSSAASTIVVRVSLSWFTEA